MGSKKQAKVEYTGVSKEELAAQQRKYEETIGLLSGQNQQLQAQFGDLSKQYENDYGQRISLLSSQMDTQKGYYDSLLNNANESLAQSKKQTELTQQRYAELDETQRKQLELQRAEQERGSLMQREQQQRLTTQVTQSSTARAKRPTRRASLLRPTG